MWKFEYFWKEMGQIKVKITCLAAPFKHKIYKNIDFIFYKSHFFMDF